YLTILVKDPEAQVRREAAIAIRHLTSPEAAALWTQLANQHDGTDRWYLEALGIGAEGQWDSFFTTWAEQQNTQALTSAAQKDIVWRARSPQAIPFLASLASNPSESLDQRLRYFRAFDFNANSPEKSKALLDMLDSPMGSEDPEQQIKIKKLVLTHLDPGTIRQSRLAMQSLQEVLKTIEGTMEYVEMVQRLQLKEENPNLLQLAISHSDQQVGRTAAATLLNQGGEQLVRQELYGSDETNSLKMMTAIRSIGSKASLQLLEDVAFNATLPLPLRREATASLGRSYGGENRVLELLRENKLPNNLIASAVTGVSYAWRQHVRTEAASYLDHQSRENATALPPVKELQIGRASCR